MSNELLAGESNQWTFQEKTCCVKDTTPQNITVILPAFNEEVSIGSVVLRAKKIANRVVVVDNAILTIREVANLHAEIIRNLRIKI